MTTSNLHWVFPAGSGNKMFLCSADLSLSLSTFFFWKFFLAIMASLLLSACFWFSKMYLSQAAWSHRPQSVIGSWILMDSVSRSDKWSSSVREKEQLGPRSQPSQNQPLQVQREISLSITSLLSLSLLFITASICLFPNPFFLLTAAEDSNALGNIFEMAY